MSEKKERKMVKFQDFSVDDWVNGASAKWARNLKGERNCKVGITWLVEFELRMLVEFPYRNVHQVTGDMDWTLRFGGHLYEWVNQNHEKG